MRKLVKFSSVCVALAMSVVTFAGLRHETERADAADSSYQITFKTNTGDGSTITAGTTQPTTVISDGASYVSSFTTATKASYAGGSGLKLGTSSASGVLTLALASSGQVTATKVVVNAKLYNSKYAATLKVNNLAAQDLTANFANYEYDVTGLIQSLTLTTSKYAWVSSVSVYYGASTTLDSIDSVSATLRATTEATEWTVSDLAVTGKLNGGTTSVSVLDYVDVTFGAVPTTAGTSNVSVTVSKKDGVEGSATTLSTTLSGTVVEKPKTTTVSISERASTLKWTNGVAQSDWKDKDGVFTFTALNGGNNGKYYTSDQSWRIYNGGTAQITGDEEHEIYAVSSNPKSAWTVDPTTNSASASPTASVNFTSITIEYYEHLLTKHDVSFEKGNDNATGELPEGFKVVDGGSFEVPGPNTLVLANHTFAGWSDGTDTYEEGSEYENVTADVTLTAQWTENAYHSLTYKAGDGTGDDVVVTKSYVGTTVTVAACSFTAPEGKEFASWSAEGIDEETLEVGDTFKMPNNDVTLTATYRNVTVKHTLTYKAGDGTGDDVTSQVAVGDTVTVSACSFTAPQYKTFTGWTDGTNEYAVGDEFEMPDNDVTLTAQYAYETVTLTYNANGGENAPAPVTQNKTSTFTVADAGEMSKASYTFNGWNTSADGKGTSYAAGDEITNVVNDLTLYAVWCDEYTHDIINNTLTGVTGNTYTTWNVTTENNVTYAGCSAGSNSSVQLRSDVKDNKYPGLVNTTSIGLARRITLTFNSSTASGRVIDVYGSNDAFAVKDMYDEDSSIEYLGYITYGETTELAIEGDYSYVGIRSNSGAIYLSSIDIAWEKVTVEPLTVSTEVGYSATKTEEGYAFDNYSLRFSAVLDEERVEAYSAKENVTYGFAVIPTALLGQETLTVDTANALVRTTDTLNEGNEAGLVLPLPVAQADTNLSVVFFVKVGDTVAEYSEVLTVNFADAALALAMDDTYLATLTESQQESLLALAESLM